MPVFAAAAAAAPFIKKVVPISFAKKSPRYGGGDGPLFSTVNGFLTRIAQGDLQAIRDVDRLRHNDADKKQWQLLWDQHVPLQPMNDAQRQLVLQLDPSKAAILPAARSGPPVLANPGEAPPDPLSLAVEPLRAAIVDSTAASEASIREAAAQTIERIGVGGAAAGAAQVRGTTGPLDQLIVAVQKPGVLLAVGIGVIVLIAGVAYVAGRR